MKKIVSICIVALSSCVMIHAMQDDDSRRDSVAMQAQSDRKQEIVLTIEEAQLLVEAWDRLEELVEAQTRAPRQDTQTGGPAVISCCNDSDLAIIRSCICAIKNQLCALGSVIGTCTDGVIPQITDAACVTQADINAICASIISWNKTIVSELRGNQITCP
jgi:hypothetical protein